MYYVVLKMRHIKYFYHIWQVDFVNEDDKVHFYTGFTNWDTLHKLFELLLFVGGAKLGRIMF